MYTCVQDRFDGMQSHIMHVTYVRDRVMLHSCVTFIFLQDYELADVWKLLKSMETETQVKEAAVRSFAEDSQRYHRAACEQLVDALSRLQSVQDAVLRSEVGLRTAVDVLSRLRCVQDAMLCKQVRPAREDFRIE